MDITLDNRKLAGTVKVIQSKSFAHRIMLSAALAEITSGAHTEVLLDNDSEDVRATKRVIAALGSGEELLDCGESGTTFRFIVPICAAQGRREVTRFTGHGRLLQRPMGPLMEAMEAHGVSFEYEENVLVCRGRLRAGEYTIAANVSSQYISGLLFALPLLEGDSVLNLTGTVESRPYIDITLDVLKDFGIVIEEEAVEAGAGSQSSGGSGGSAGEAPVSARFKIPGGQVYRGPAQMEVEGDWSNTAFWLAAGAIGCSGAACSADGDCSGGAVCSAGGHDAVTVTGLNLNSVQGDKAILDVLRRFGAEVTEDAASGSVTCSGPADGSMLRGCDIDVKDIPDAVPIVSVVAAAAAGVTRIYNAGRLRMKESDRLVTVAAMLTALGAKVEEGEDYLMIHGAGRSADGDEKTGYVSGIRPLQGGTVDGANDHRIVMSAATAAIICQEPVTILGAQAVNKSYPGFFEERENL